MDKEFICPACNKEHNNTTANTKWEEKERLCYQCIKIYLNAHRYLTKLKEMEQWKKKKNLQGIPVSTIG